MEHVINLEAQLAATEHRLAIKRRPLLDADPQDDTYAVLLRQVDRLEREIAATNYQLMRAA